MGEGRAACAMLDSVTRQEWGASADLTNLNVMIAVDYSTGLAQQNSAGDSADINLKNRSCAKQRLTSCEQV